MSNLDESIDPAMWRVEYETVSKSVINAVTNVKKLGQSKLTHSVLQGRLDLLDRYWSQCKKLHCSLQRTLSDADVETHEFLVKNKIEKLEEQYLIAYDFLKERLGAFSTPTLPSSSSTSTGSARDKVNETVKLPQIELPKFDGDYKEWSNFCDLFKSIIVDNTSLSNVQKLHYLKLSLQGEASLLLKNTTVTDKNFATAWELLESRYNDTRAIINAHFNALYKIPPITSNFLVNLKNLRDTTSEIIAAFKNLKCPVEHWDYWLVYHTVQKLDKVTRREWETELCETTDYPSWDELNSFLDSRIRALEAIGAMNSSTDVNKYHQSKSSRSVPIKTLHVSSQSICHHCKENHQIYHCTKFKSLNVVQRSNIIKKFNLCSNCLNKGHSTKNCMSKISCFYCQKRHHTLLHQNPTSTGQSVIHRPVQSIPTTENIVGIPSTSNQNIDSNSNSVLNNHVHSPENRKYGSILLATAWVLLRSGLGGTIRVRALLDQGSESSFVSEDVVQTLRLPREKISASISGLGGCQTGIVKNAVQFTIEPLTGTGPLIPVKALVLTNISSYHPKTHFQPNSYSHLRNISFADYEASSSTRVDLLIGSDVYGQVLLDGVRQGPPGSPTAQNTIFGWILSGPVSSASIPASIQVHHSYDSHPDEFLRKFWELEEIPCQPHYSEEEKTCEEHFLSTYSRSTDGKFVVRLPRKIASQVALGESKPIAISSFNRLEKRLVKKVDLYNSYKQFMKEYEELGHMREIPQTERDDSYVFLPHHPVVREERTTTKLRVVFNASSPTSNGNSLNDLLLPGPKLQSDLSLIILNWRSFRWAYCADIAKMFRAVWVHPADQHLQCIVWRSAPSDNLKTYKLTTVTYGTTSAPYLAMRAIKQLVEEQGQNYPLAVPTLNENIYVDDVLFGADDHSLAIEARLQVTQLLQSAGFHLRKWSSNHPALLQGIDPSDHNLTPEKIFEENDDLKILGVQWAPTNDCFRISIKHRPIGSLTKRSLLSTIAQIFDPLGWITPVVIVAKILIQAMWTQKIGWDDPLPSDLISKWNLFYEPLVALTKISIPRWTGQGHESLSVELHGFSDASNVAYAAALYLRVLTVTGEYKTSLHVAKSKVAPIKTISVPRLELCGALLLAKLIAWVKSSTQFQPIPVYCWTDSTATLGWINKDPSHWKTFIANRVSQIQTKVPSADWRYVPSEQNPADIASRGISAELIENHPLWWNGPYWLREDKTDWPEFPTPEFRSDAREDKRSTLVHSATTTLEWDLIYKISSWPRLLRVTGYVLRFIHNLKRTNPLETGLSLRPNELVLASNYWIRTVQELRFSKEILALRGQKELPTHSPLKNLNPYLDESGILRVGGRLRHSQLSFNRKFPIILPKHRISELIIAHTHKITLHGGTQLTLRILRERFWVLGARNLAKAHLHRCVTCARQTVTSISQYMGDLPPHRITPNRPFSHTGVDYAGPLLVRDSSGRGMRSHKCYISLFVCLATRAIHLELVHDYTTTSFLAALKRFVARRGTPSDLYSDRGTNFQGASKELSQNLTLIHKNPDLHSQLSSEGVNWHFLPPASPHFGGIWEAGVKSVKYHLKRMLAAHTPTAEELTTLLCNIESCLNSRPISPLTDNVEDFEALTPGHFLIGSSLKSLPEPSLLDVKDSRLTRWQLVQKLSERFWHIWSADYLNSLQQRAKWTKHHVNLREGDMVLISNQNLPPSRWELGRVLQCHPGKDGLVRVVTVRTAQTVLTRPITKLCKLPISS